MENDKIEKTDTSEPGPLESLCISFIGILNNVFSAWILLTFWGWFIFGVVAGAPALNMAACIGIIFIFWHINSDTRNVKMLMFLNKNTDSFMKNFLNWFGDLFLNIFTLGMGAMWHFWLLPSLGW